MTNLTHALEGRNILMMMLLLLLLLLLLLFCISIIKLSEFAFLAFKVNKREERTEYRSPIKVGAITEEQSTRIDFRLVIAITLIS